MKFVLLLQSLSVVAVFGRAIDESTDIASETTNDEQSYRFRYNVADETTGDFKSQTEVRDESGVVTGMYKVLQPDGCVRVVHYTADAMGFHPTVTYEGDCQQSGSINSAATAASTSSAAQFKSSEDDDSAAAISKDVSAPTNPSAALLSRPVHSAVPGLINPTTDVTHDSIQEEEKEEKEEKEEAFIPSQTSAQEKFIVPLVASISQMPANIATLWQNIGKPFKQQQQTASATGSVPASDDDATVVVEATRISDDPVDEVVPSIPTSDDKFVKIPESDVPQVNSVPEIVVVAPLVASTQSVENTVPQSILTLLDSFNPDKKEEEVDPLQVEASEIRVSRNNEQDSPVVESVKKEESGTVETAGAIESESRHSEAEISHHPSEPKTENAVEEEEEGENERSNLSGFVQSTLDTVKNVTAPLTQLVQNLQNLTKPVTELFNGFKKPTGPTTVLPVVEAPVTSESPVGKIPEIDETEQIPAERIVTDHHHVDEASGPAVDVAAVAESHQTLDSSSSLLGEPVASKESVDVVVDSVPIVVQNLGNAESISIEVNDPVGEETAEPVKVEQSAAVPSDGLSLFKSAGLESIEPVEQVDVKEASIAIEKEADAGQPSELVVEDTPTAESTQYAQVVAPIVYSAPIEAGSFLVHSPSSSHRAEARSMPYGMRMQAAFIPTYAAPAAIVYGQQRRQSYARFVPAAPSKQQRNDYGTRQSVRINPPPTNSHYAVRPAAPKATWSPFYSTYVY